MISFLIRIFYITVTLILVFVAFKSYSPFNKNDLERIIDNNKIVIATRIGPTTYYEIKNQKIGYSYDVMREFAKYLNVELEILSIEDAGMALNDLNQRKVDILADIGVLEEVQLVYSQTKTDYYLVFNQRYHEHNELIKSNRNKIVVVDIPHIIESLKKHLDQKIYSYEIINDKNIDELVHLLAENKIKYTVLSSEELTFYQGYFPQIVIAKKIGTDIKNNWAIPKNTNNQLSQNISRFFTEMLKKNKLKYIKQKNLNSNKKYTFIGSKKFINDLTTIFPLYEFYFKSYSKKYNHDWKLLASIGYQESRWDKNAISYTGVKGIMMLTKNTSMDMGVKDRTDPKESIYGGAKYLRKMVDKIPDQINEEDRIWYAVAAYNIGYGHLIDAINMAKKDNITLMDWKSLEPYLLKLSQSKHYRKTKYGYARGWETVKYVQNIRQYYDILVFLDSQDNIINNNEIDNKIPSTL